MQESNCSQFGFYLIMKRPGFLTFGLSLEEILTIAFIVFWWIVVESGSAVETDARQRGWHERGAASETSPPWEYYGIRCLSF